MIELLDSIRGSDPNTAQETDWLEWKGGLDLSTAHGKFIVSKAILAFSNRSVDAAAQYCQGDAYLVIGVEPGVANGIDAIDSADLEGRISTYVKGPRWNMRFLSFHDVIALVITVDSPRHGDPIFTLQKTFGDGKKSADAGTIFQRGLGKSKPAGVSEVEMLSDRLLAGKASLRADAAWDDLSRLLAQLADGRVARGVEEYGEINDKIAIFHDHQRMIDHGNAYMLAEANAPFPADLAGEIGRMLTTCTDVGDQDIEECLRLADDIIRKWKLLDEGLRLPAVENGCTWVSERDRESFETFANSLLPTLEEFETAIRDESERDPVRDRTVMDISGLLQEIAASKSGHDPYLAQELGRACAVVKGDC